MGIDDELDYTIYFIPTLSSTMEVVEFSQLVPFSPIVSDHRTVRSSFVYLSFFHGFHDLHTAIYGNQLLW